MSTKARIPVACRQSTHSLTCAEAHIRAMCTWGCAFVDVTKSGPGNGLGDVVTESDLLGLKPTARMGLFGLYKLMVSKNGEASIAPACWLWPRFWPEAP